MVHDAACVLDLLSLHQEDLRAFGVKRLGLFGSVARGEGREDSDLDFVVELEQHTFDNYMGLALYLQDLFGCKVDLLELEAVKPRLKPIIEREAVYAPGL